VRQGHLQEAQVKRNRRCHRLVVKPIRRKKTRIYGKDVYLYGDLPDSVKGQTLLLFKTDLTPTGAQHVAWVQLVHVHKATPSGIVGFTHYAELPSYL
jgi:hypothetical protein